ncbi:hypothetical protein TNCV_1913431 [Trichonephila clavipes]|nr:hypothetical protein TNCV_1913431 [Trichonephila clavipes]
MDDNVMPHRANLVEEFLRSEDICRMDWSPDLCRALLGRSRQGNCNSQLTFENPPRPENRVAERMESIAIETH